MKSLGDTILPNSIQWTNRDEWALLVVETTRFKWINTWIFYGIFPQYSSLQALIALTNTITAPFLPKHAIQQQGNKFPCQFAQKARYFIFETAL
ncbi:MAG: hypothetical protein H7839_13475 [Magnetococcus sp. YQC-5]